MRSVNYSIVVYKKRKSTLTKIKKHWQLYLFILLPVTYLLIFRYLPMVGLQIAFKDYNISAGMFGSRWVGFKHFINFFSSYQFSRIIFNTIGLSVYTIVACFFPPIILAFESRQFVAAIDNCFMSFINAETHVGTHVECPAHLKVGEKSPADMQLNIFFGEAIVLKFDAIPLGPKHFEKVQKGDIVLLYGPDNKCYITPEGGKCLLNKGIKLLGVQGVLPDDPRAYEVGSSIEPETHKYLLGNDIPMIENLYNLDQIKSERIFFFGFPLKIHRIDSSWVRAVVFEKIA